MRKRMIMLMSILIVFAMLSSCSTSNDSSKDTVDSGVIWLPNQSVTGDSSMGDAPCIERYAFSTIEDFELFCTTGSRDVTLYSSQSKDNMFPPFNMLEGCFVEISQLFPELDQNNVTIDHIEIVNSGRYSYSGYTNVDQTPFRITINYKSKSSGLSVSTVVNALDTSAYDQVICADYYDAKTQAPSKKGSTVYVFELSKCIVQYSFYKEKIEGVVIHSGNYEIGISPRYSDNDAFFTDETLKELSCIFEDSDDRSEALSKIAAFAESK